jgi:hypothetical protein
MIPSDPGYSNLYSCQIDPTTKKWISPSTPCPKGCAPQPPGVPDRCKLTLPGRYAPASSPAPHPGSGAARSA